MLNGDGLVESGLVTPILYPRVKRKPVSLIDNPNPVTKKTRALPLCKRNTVISGVSQAREELCRRKRKISPEERPYPFQGNPEFVLQYHTVTYTRGYTELIMTSCTACLPLSGSGGSDHVVSHGRLLGACLSSRSGLQTRQQMCLDM